MNARFVGAVLRAASIAAVPLAALTISAPAGAQGGGQRELFDWRGNVDQEIRVEMQGGRVSVIAMGPREMTGYDNARTMSGVPATNGYVSVQMREGRGNADVVQQPNAGNGYTTIVRIRDAQSGAGSYDVAAFWQPTGGYGYGNQGQNGQNGQNGQYGQYDQYPAPVVIQQRSVYGARGEGEGKTLPSASRGNAQPSRAQYPMRASNDGRYNDGRYQNGSVRTAKELPQSNQAGQSGKALPARNQSNQSGKTLPGANGTYQRRGH